MTRVSHLGTCLLAILAALTGGCQAERNPCPTLTGPGRECWAGVGECRRTGHLVCHPERGWPVCDAVPGEPALEVCDGLDNDCDGAIDEPQEADPTCQDGQFCNGKEVCREGSCRSLGRPACPGQNCDENEDVCLGCTSDADCEDNLFCNGRERCEGGICKQGTNPCPGQICDEDNDVCAACAHDSDCEDNLFCNGRERCEGGICKQGTYPCPGQNCDENDDACVGCASDADCEDELFCNGQETCEGGICKQGSYPCPGQNCDENHDACVPCTSDADCEDGLFCNEIRICESGSCRGTGQIPCYRQECDENLDICIPCTSDAECDDWFRRPLPRDHPDCRSFICLDGGCNGVSSRGRICDDGIDCTVGVCSNDSICYTIEDYEGSTYDDICRDGTDNDCDGLTDYEEPDCCVPDCAGVECGDGGCRDQQFACGTCPEAGESCRGGQCLPTGPEWVFIPGGTYMMGSPDGVGQDDEHPQHQVTVQSFEMLRTEVTVAQYLDCVEAGACTEPLRPGDCDVWCNRCNWTVAGRDNHPVVCVNWYQAVDYCRYIGGRLPSEAEWEYAARSGGQDITYPWGDEEATCYYAVIFSNEPGIDDPYSCGLHHEWPVCSKPAGNTAQGLCDMAGNVGEWVKDWKHDSYNGAPCDGSAWDYPPGHSRVIRGGGWDYGAFQQRAADRTGCVPNIGADSIGFRCVRELVL